MFYNKTLATAKAAPEDIVAYVSKLVFLPRRGGRGLRYASAITSAPQSMTSGEFWA